MGNEEDYTRLEFSADGKVTKLSASTITQAWMCQRKIYFHYIAGEKETVVNGAAVRGSGIDVSIQKLFLDKASGKKTNLRDAIDAGVAEVERTAKKYEDNGVKVKWKEEDDYPGGGLDDCKSDIMRGVGYLWESSEGVGHLTPHPEAPVQDAFEITLRSGITLIGTLDLRSINSRGGCGIHDVKTSGKKWPRGKEDMGIQPPIYTMGQEAVYGSPPDSFDYRVLVFNKKEPLVETRTTNVTKSRLRALPLIVEQTASMIGAMKKGVLPAPSGYLSQSFACSYCGYKKLCRESGLPL